MRRYLARRGPDARQDLAVDYARVFLAAGVYEGETAVPYESVYTSPEGILMQDSRDEVVRAYRRWGLAIPRDLNVPEDHLAFELEFMGRLSERIAAGLGAEGHRSQKASSAGKRSSAACPTRICRCCTTRPTRSTPSAPPCSPSNRCSAHWQSKK